MKTFLFAGGRGQSYIVGMSQNAETAADRLRRAHRRKMATGVSVGMLSAAFASIFGLVLPLVTVLVATFAWRFERRWARPARALRIYLRDGDLNALDRVAAPGGLAGIVPHLQTQLRAKQAA